MPGVQESTNRSHVAHTKNIIEKSINSDRVVTAMRTILLSISDSGESEGGESGVVVGFGVAVALGSKIDATSGGSTERKRISLLALLRFAIPPRKESE